MEKKYLCIDVGGTSIKYAVLDSRLQFSARGSVVTPYDGVETYLDTLETYFSQCKGERTRRFQVLQCLFQA